MTISSKPIILVTGGTGYLGSHIIFLLLSSGKYRVRAVVRPQSVRKLETIFPPPCSDIDIVTMETLTDDWSAATVGVYGVIHCAAPAYFKDETRESVWKGTYDATLNLTNAAIKNGVRRVIVTGTTVSLTDLNLTEGYGQEPLGPESFSPTEFSSIDIKTDSPKMLYRAAKSLVDKQLWKIAERNPQVDITVIISPVLFGPLLPTYPLPVKNRDLSTINTIYSLVSGSKVYPALPIGYMADVRDIAKAHVLALSAQRFSERRKRLILCSRTFNWPEVVALIKKRCPQLIQRLPDASVNAPRLTGAPLDLSLGHEVLGWTDYINWEESILECVRVGLRWEESFGGRAD